MRHAFRSQIPVFNRYVDQMIRRCIDGLPFEYSFGYKQVALSPDFPSWLKTTKKGWEEHETIRTTLFALFLGESVDIEGSWATVGAPQVTYKYRLDFFHPVSNRHESEWLFWERVAQLTERIRNFDFRVFSEEVPGMLANVLITPLSSIQTTPYSEFANTFCHYTAYEFELIDVQPYSAAEGRILAQQQGGG